MFGLGAGELLLIFAFALIFIGPKKLPELARNLGKGLREFQRAKDDLMDQVKAEEVAELEDEKEKTGSVKEILTGVAIDEEQGKDTNEGKDKEHA